MKSAVKTIPVFSVAGDYVIGEICGGSKTLVLGETQKGTVVAYIVGIIKPEHSELLVEEDDWFTAADEKEKLLCFAVESAGKDAKHLIDAYIEQSGLLGGFAPVERSDIKAGDLLLGQDGGFAGVYMGDGSAAAPNRQGRMERIDVSKLAKARFARPLHPDFEREDAEYTRRLRKVKGGMQGDDVRAVQRALSSLGMFEGKPDGRFSAKLIRAVKKFQKENSLPADGTVGYAEWKLLAGG